MTPDKSRTLEISLRVIGAPENYPSRFGPVTVESMLTNNVERYALDASTTASLWMCVELSTWVPDASPDWLSASASISDINGYVHAKRPVLLYDRPYDVPTVTSFHLPELHFALSIRRVS